MQHAQSTRRRSRRGSRPKLFTQGWKTFGAFVLTLGLSLGALIAVSAPATAASGGIGWGVFGDPEYKFAGTFVQDGQYVVCGEVGKPTPTDPLNNIGVRGTDWINSNLSSNWGEYPALNDDTVAGISSALASYSHTTDPTTAAALEYAVHRVMYPNSALRNFGGTPMDSYDDVIYWDLVSRIGGDNVWAVQTTASAITAEIYGASAGYGATGSGELMFTTEAGRDDRGTVSMIGTADSTGTITLTNAVFTSTGQSIRTDVEAGVVYQIRTVAPTQDGASYRVSGTGNFTAPGEQGYAAELEVWASNTGQQSSVSFGGFASNDPFPVSGEDAHPRTVTFLPVVTTTAEAFVQRGESFTDVLTFDTVANQDGIHNPWFRTDADYLPLTASGVVYGPFQTPPTPAESAPLGAPVAGHASVVTSGEGPSKTYRVSSVETAPTSGYYVWVWQITASEQPSETRGFLPTEYAFRDGFGLTEETSTTPMRLRAQTQVTQPEIALGSIPGDQAWVEREGFWLTDAEGDPIAVTVRWDAYFHPGNNSIPRVAAPEIPAEAELIGSVTQTVSGTGAVSTPNDVAELGFRAPTSGEGSIVWVFSIRSEDQGENAPLVEPWQDDYGVPSEIQRLAQPAVSTAASPGANPGQKIQDQATVSGTLPDNGMTLTFSGFKVPVTADGKIAYPLTPTPTPTPLGDDTDPKEQTPALPLDDDLSWVCTAENQVFTTESTPVLVTETGTYLSPEVTAPEHGLILWQESAWSIPRGDEPSELIARGTCGIEAERSSILTVTTKANATNLRAPDASDPASGAAAPSTERTGAASATADGGSEVWDTVNISGWIPQNASVSVELFQFNAEDPVCSAETTLWQSTALSLTGGQMVQDLELDLRDLGQSTIAPVVTEQGWQLGFIETVHDGRGQVIAQGTCGLANETLNIALPVLAETGEEDAISTIWWLVGALGTMLGLTLIAMVSVPRGRRD